MFYNGIVYVNNNEKKLLTTKDSSTPVKCHEHKVTGTFNQANFLISYRAFMYYMTMQALEERNSRFETVFTESFQSTYICPFKF